MPRACVVIPAKNEEKSIESVINEVRRGLRKTRYDQVTVIVVDDSTDRTREIALRNGAHVVRGGGDGLGAAMFRGLRTALEFEPDVILAIDGDGQADAAAEIPRFLQPIDDGEADFVLGSRFLEPGLVGYRYRFINRFGTRILSSMLRAHTGLRLTDSHGGIRAMVPAVVAELEMLGTHTYVQETIMDAAENGFRIKEIPSVWRERAHGGSRVVSSIPRYVFYTLPILLLRSGQHVRYLYTAGLLLVVLPVLYFLMILAEEGFTLALGHRTPAFILITLMITSGINLFFFGFILQILKQVKKIVDRRGEPVVTAHHPDVPDPVDTAQLKVVSGLRSKENLS